MDDKELERELSLKTDEPERLPLPQLVNEMFVATATEICSKVPEIRSVALIIDWKVGSTDFPCASLYVRESERNSVDARFGIIEQARKFLIQSLTFVGDYASALSEHTAKLVAELDETNKKMVSKSAAAKKDT